MKSTFDHYPEVKALAGEAYPFASVRVQSSIFGDDHVVLVNDVEKVKGTWEMVNKCLKEKIEYDREVCK